MSIVSNFLDQHHDTGLLILRIGIGGMFVFHGYGKLFGGPDVWAKLGSSMSYVGINFMPTFFGFIAAVAEFGGGICLISGFFFRQACFFLLCTMIVATSTHLGRGDGLKGASHAIEAGILFLSLIFIGPGKKIMYKIEE